QQVSFPIDLFFEQLAQDQPDKTVGIILSGTGSDGTRGVKAIKEKGGTVIVQDPSDAKFNGMPHNAIATHLADLILDIPNIQNTLQNLQHSYTVIPDPSNITSYQRILTLIYQKTNLDFSHYKPKTIQRRILKRMQLKHLIAIDQYYQYLLKNESEVLALQQDLLIGVTQFFRNPEAYEIIREKVIPQIFEKKTKNEGIRVWVAGCSTGEEAYSLAILLAEHKKANGLTNPVTIFATDIDANAIQIASHGAYSKSIITDLNPDYLRRYFIQKEGHYVITKEIRNQIVFATHNLVIDPPFNRIDLLSCRNLLIYFNRGLQDKAFTLFQYSLREQGLLFLGPSESIPRSLSNYIEIHKRWRIYQHDGSKPTYSEGIMEDLTRPLTGLSKGTGEIGAKSILLTEVGESLYRNYLQQYGPMVLFTNQYFEVLYLSGGISQLLKLPENRLSFSLLKILPEPLRAPINTAVQKAIRTKEPVLYQSIPLEMADGKKVAIIKATPIPQAEDQTQKIVLVSLDLKNGESDSSTLESLKAENLAQDPMQRIKILESSLQDSRDTLMATIEELETSNEELQASNEEMMTTNEELQSANEELQSVNEELQSVNEELHTTNGELQAKIIELTELTDDMENLFAATGVCALFLDSELRIRKFTPSFQTYLAILPQDIGRELKVFYSDLDVRTLTKLSKEVLQSGKMTNFQKKLDENQDLLIRILPYYTYSKQIKGVVITIFNLLELPI
ncbi:MAG: CheR family methyltransferase, partial [Bacteroidota bacterium]